MLLERVVEGIDVGFLFDPRFDGFEQDKDLSRQMGFAPMALDDWFEPFNSERHVPPYAR
ncbi:hypothetical protein [Arthrobacter sp. Soil762]|uniref:hypothetical protein n=1 Tax=Arthrobacter sp. Soil762 TaxID=1736401 RepID=UPI000AEB1B42|nr:hypothetical protein [Arthrobacter sp. Soil762]